MDFILHHPGSRANQITESLNIPLRTLQRELGRLKASGQITFRGAPKKWRVLENTNIKIRFYRCFYIAKLVKLCYFTLCVNVGNKNGIFMISEAEAILKTNEILVSDKTNLNIFWIKDRSLADLDNLPSPDELATDIMKSLQSTLESFQQLTAKLGK